MNWRLLFLILLLGLGYLSIILIKKDYQEYFIPKIAVTIFPFYDLTKEIIGDKFEVILITPPGAEPHNFEPSPGDLKKLYGSMIFFTSGTILDKWINKIIFNFPQAKIVNLNQNLNLIDDDPHFWLSLENMKKVAQTIVKEMESFDPQNKNYYQNNLREVNKKLDQILESAKKETLLVKNRYLLTQHNAFNYLAQELNLNVIGYLASGNKELTPLELKNLIDKIRLFKIKIIFKEPGEENVFLKTLAQELELKIYELDPIEGKSGLDYFSAYRQNVEVLKKALSY